MIEDIGIVSVPVHDQDRLKQLIQRTVLGWALLFLMAGSPCSTSMAQDADLILHHGRIVTVDRASRLVRRWLSRMAGSSESALTTRCSRHAGRVRRSSISAARWSCPG